MYADLFGTINEQKRDIMYVAVLYKPIPLF